MVAAVVVVIIITTILIIITITTTIIITIKLTILTILIILIILILIMILIILILIILIIILILIIIIIIIIIIPGDGGVLNAKPRLRGNWWISSPPFPFGDLLCFEAGQQHCGCISSTFQCHFRNRPAFFVIKIQRESRLNRYFGHLRAENFLKSRQISNSVFQSLILSSYEANGETRYPKIWKERANCRSSDTQHYTRYHILAMAWQSLMTFLRRWQEHPSALGHSGYCWHKCVHSWPQREHQCLGHRFFRPCQSVGCCRAEDVTRSGTVATHMETCENAGFDVWNRQAGMAKAGHWKFVLGKMSGGRPSKGVLCPGNISGACTRSPRALLHFTTKIRKFHEISEARSVSASWLPQEAPVSQGSSNKLKHHPVLIQGQFLHAQKAPCETPHQTFQHPPTISNSSWASSKSGTCLPTAAYKNFLASSFFFLYSSLFLGWLSWFHRIKNRKAMKVGLG